MSRVPRTLALAACAIATAAALAPVAAASSRGIRVGVAPLVPAPTRLLGILPQATKLQVTVALAPRDPAALAAFASAVSTPGSGVYRDYITPAQFAQRFGPTAAQISAVRSSLRAHGLAPGAVSANGLAIPVTSTAGAVGHALSISFTRLVTPSGRVAVASTAAPLFDARVAKLVQGVVGLNTLSVPQPLSAPQPLAAHPSTTSTVHPSATTTGHLSAPHVVTGGPQPCAGASAAAPGLQAYTIDQIAAAYGFSGLYGQGNEGAGQTIAVYELEPNAVADIAAYQACYGTAASVSYVPVDGGVGAGAGTGEAALDIENVIGLAPKASVIVYQGPNSNSGAAGAGPYDTYAAIISQNTAKVIATSWGQCEPMEGSTDAVAESTLFQEAAAQGQTIVSASGDNGSEDCFIPGQNLNLQPAVDDPSSQQFVTSVGGTSLTTLGPPPSEVVWNNGGGLQALLGTSAGAGGGGISSFWKMPTYQLSAPAALRTINGDSSGAPCGGGSVYCRQVPDVSADADPFTGYLIYYDGNWSSIGGTSAAAPVWAALIALANASPACSGTSVGFANPALYRAAGSPQYASYFNDVIAGNNDFTGSNGGKFSAGPGYDMGSGLGSPIASALALPLCETVTLTNPGPQASILGHRVRLHITATDAANASLTFRAPGLPSGLSIDHATGVVAGKPRRAGVSTVVVSATDTAGRTNTISFPWRILVPTVLTVSPPKVRCKHHVCSASASRNQTVVVRSGSRARVTLYVVTSTGVAVASASVSITDGHRSFTVRTGRLGTASFVLGKGPNRAVRAVYAGGVSVGPASLNFRIRNRR
jgi:subtilase family serine protease